MKNVIIPILLCLSFAAHSQIVADHTSVDLYDDIPQQWIDSVKTMWLNYTGRSHSLGIGNGIDTLETIDPTYAANFKDAGGVDSPTDINLRVDRATWGNYEYSSGWQRWYAEDSWWTTSTGISRTKAGLTYANSIGNPITVFGFGHSYEFYGNDSSATADPVTGNYWYGWTQNGPDGSIPWGLDDADNTLTGNSLNMDDYLAATQEFIDYCADSISTTVIFTTGPVERDDSPATDQAMYNGYLKNEHIRNYVNTNGGYLFDYGDILCYNNAGEEQTLTWNGNTFPVMHPDNTAGSYTSHIGMEGALRLAKGMWYLLARIAGWSGDQAGVEKITDGDLSSATNWNTDPNVTISGGVATFDGLDYGYLSQSDASLVTPMDTSKEYMLEFDISNTTGLTYIRILSTSLSEVYVADDTYEDGSHKVIFTTPSNIGDGGILFYASDDFSIDNISLYETATIGDDPYYVATDGNDAASGDINNPWETFERAIQIASPGDTIYFRGGVYYRDEGGVSIDAYNGVGNNGTVDNWIYYMNYPGETPIFDFSNYVPTVQYGGLGINYSTYLYFRGLHVTNMGQGAQEDSVSLTAIGAYGSANLVFENCAAYNNGGRGFAFFGGFNDLIGSDTTITQPPEVPDVPADTVKFINCDSYSNCDSLDVGSFIGGLADGFKANNTQGAHILFRGCRAWLNSDDGFDPNGGASIHIDNCWSFLNGYLEGDGYGIKTIGLDTTYYQQPSTSPVLRRLTNSIITYNRDVGFSLGMRASYYLPPTEIYNNTGYKTNTSFVQSAEHYGDDNPVIYKNNIAWGDEPEAPNVINSGTFQGSHNSFEMGYPWEDSLTISASDFTVTLDSSTIVQQLTAPRQADGSLPDITVFKLAETSWMKGAGTDVGMSSIPDIGIDWDYLGASSPTQSVTGSVRPASGSPSKAFIINGRPQRIAIE